MGYNWAKNTMKKILLICFGIALLSGLYSFRTIDRESPKGIEKVVVDNDLCDCNYRLYVETCTGFWYLKLKNGCPDPIIATCKYTIYYDDGTHKTYSENVRLNGNWETVVASGNTDHSSCTADSVDARFAN